MATRSKSKAPKPAPVHYRQGDVLITRVAAVPADAESVPIPPGRVVLAEGEATGHAHIIASRFVASSARVADSDLFLTVADGATVVHDEHDPIPLPAGTYRVRRQREYAPEAIRNVAD